MDLFNWIINSMESITAAIKIYRYIQIGIYITYIQNLNVYTVDSFVRPLKFFRLNRYTHTSYLLHCLPRCCIHFFFINFFGLKLNFWYRFDGAFKFMYVRTWWGRFFLYLLDLISNDIVSVIIWCAFLEHRISYIECVLIVIKNLWKYWLKNKKKLSEYFFQIFKNHFFALNIVLIRKKWRKNQKSEKMVIQSRRKSFWIYSFELFWIYIYYLGAKLFVWK